MKSYKQARFIVPGFTLFCILTSNFLLAQNIDWNADTIPAIVAKDAQGKFINDMKAVGRKPTTYVSFDVLKLKEIFDNCAAYGVTNIQFMIVSIRPEDTARYARLHPGLSSTERKDLIGRQTLVIKVPGSAFASVQQKSGAVFSKNNSLMVALLAAGFIKLDQPFGGLPFTESIYFSSGTICPPPASCN